VSTVVDKIQWRTVVSTVVDKIQWRTVVCTVVDLQCGDFLDVLKDCEHIQRDSGPRSAEERQFLSSWQRG